MAPFAASSDPAYLYASQSGRATLDQGEGGGNPFASAIVELLARDSLTFEAFRTGLVALTERKSGGFQRPEVLARVDLGAWQLVPKPTAERRMALVLIFSDYSATGAEHFLSGAKHDMQRISAALASAGFEVRTALDPDRTELEAVLSEFAECSSASQAAVLYTTGHGAEVGGAVYLLPGDYPFSQGRAALEAYAVRLTTLGTRLRASRANVVFYGGCRNNPFGPQ